MPLISSRPTRRRARILGAFLGIASLGACNSSAGPPSPGGVTAVSGNDQFATVGASIANPLVVLVVDENGSPMANVPVAWRVTGGGGAVADSTSTSDAGGHATMSYTAGAAPGTATVVATVAPLWTATFTVFIEPSTTR